MSASPRLVAVRPLPGKRLEARFENGATRVYDCTPLLEEPVFAALADDALFRHHVAMRDLARTLRDQLSRNRIDDFGHLLHENWLRNSWRTVLYR